MAAPAASAPSGLRSMIVMHKPAPLLSRLRRPRTTVRWRLTLLYGALFLGCGAALLAITYALVVNATNNHRTLSSFLYHHFGPVPPEAQAASRFIRSQERLADLHQLEIESAIALAIMAIASMLLGWVVAGRVLRPLRTITTTTREISETNLNRRLAIGGPRDELRELAETIDRLLERLETAFEAQRRFVTNASHELSTPLATMRATLDVAIADPRACGHVRTLDANLREDLDQADQLLESFLALARAHREQLGDQAPVSLPQLVSDAVAARTQAIATKQIQLRTALAPADVTGSDTLLEQMVANVIDNAVRHNHTDGTISIETDADQQAARLTVESSGPTLDPAAVAQLAQPFRRLGAERTGSHNGHGLGLSIVAAVAAAHHGALKLNARPQGGLRVQITLPASTAARPPAITA
jgi:signal transduction histidine kinase